MPIKWTPELDSILLHCVFEESGISFSKALCTKISDRVKGTGIDCTPKAVENRLYSWKKKNVSATPSAPTPSKSKDASATPTPAKSGKAKTGRARAGKKQVTPESEEPESPSVKSKKRARTEDDDEEEIGEKKIKVEDVGGHEEDESEEV